jgi:hypothetical protein
VGEKIHFQAVFQNVSALPVALSIDVVVLINREGRFYPSYGLLVNLHTLRLANSFQMAPSSITSISDFKAFTPAILPSIHWDPGTVHNLR